MTALLVKLVKRESLSGEFQVTLKALWRSIVSQRSWRSNMFLQALVAAELDGQSTY